MERKFGYDTKHASHLLRLMYEGEEILTTGKLTFPRPEAKFLLDVRNGALTFDELLKLVENYDNLFEELYDKSKLPKSPDRVKVDELCIELVKEHLKIGKE